jgi:Protein of unknown function (DUF2690)
MSLVRLLLASVSLLVVLLGATLSLGSQSTAYAHTTGQTQASVTCTGNGCNNQDPQQTGCNIGAYTVQTGVLAREFIELRYSPTCKTNWARVENRVGNNDVFLVLIERIDGLTYGSKGLVGPIAWSNMVYAPIAKARACVSVNGGDPACTIFI